MAYYMNCQQDDYARTTSYRFSVDHEQDRDLIALKRDIKIINKGIREQVRRIAEGYGAERGLTNLSYSPLQRVRLMPRGSRVAAAVKDYGYPRAYDSYLPKRYAEYFDVYVGEDTYAMYKFRDQISNGITPGQQALIAKLQQDEWDLKWKNQAILRDAGLRIVSTKNGTEYRTANE